MYLGNSVPFVSSPVAAPSVEKWNKIAEHFYTRWNMPKCVGSENQL